MATAVHGHRTAPHNASAPSSRLEAFSESQFFFRTAAAALIVLMAIMAGGAARRESVTIDEVAHLGAGVSYLQRFDLRLNPEHPPLAKMIAALPLVAHRVHADYSSRAWTISKEMAPAGFGEWAFGERVLMRWNDPRRTLAWARGSMLLLTLALGLIVCAFARRIGGNLGGLLCLAVLVSTPALLTFGPLVLTDVPMALFSLLALWTFAEMWREPTKARRRLFALSLAGALLSKFSAGILLFAFAGFILSTRFWPLPGEPAEKSARKMWRRVRWRATLKGILLAGCFFYLFYLIFSWNQPSQYMIPFKQPQDFPRLLGNALLARAIRRLLMPIWVSLIGLGIVLVTGSRPTFVLGHSYAHGVWFYFPVIFALKSPLGFLGLLALGLGTGIARRHSKRVLDSIIPENLRTHWRVLWVSLIVFTAFCMVSRLDISIRHFITPIVLLILVVAPLPRMLQALRETHATSARTMQALAALLAVSCLWTAIRAYPYYMPYVSPLGLGKPEYWLMNDSNVDWDQALPEVRQFADSHGLDKINVDAYALTNPNTYVPQSQFWNCQQPTASDARQWAAVSVNMIMDGHNCTWLMQYPHETIGGGSMYIFHLPDRIPAAGTPGGPPLPSDYRHLAGFSIDVRPVFMEIVAHPEHIPQTLSQMRAIFQLEAHQP